VVGVELAEIEELIVAFVPDDDGRPQAAFVARTRQAVPLPTLEEAWGRPPAAALQAKNYFRGSRWAYYLPPEAEGCAIVIGPPAVVEEILARDGPPLVRKGIEKLWHRSDRLRHFNLIVDPRYVWTDGLSLLVGDLERLHDPLARAFDDSIEAVLCSAHLGDELFLEVRVAGTVDNDPQKLADSLLARLRAGAEQIENYVSSLRAQPYGRMVLGRFPRMVQLLYNFTRAGAEGRQAVLRCYLPPAAAHNLLLGAELALAEPATETAASGTADRAAAVPATAAAALKKNISLSFPRDTLERCLELLSKEIDTSITILGQDLQLEGITKNQSFGLDENDRPAEEVLRTVLQLANPDGKLVYVIRPLEAGREGIFITTRSAAAKRKEALPGGLEPAKPAKKS
jgi:hypothetical protein